MLKKTKHQGNENERKGRVVFFCNTCNQVGKVFVECWTEESEGPHKIKLIQHSEIGAVEVDEIRITAKPKGKELRYHHCGSCGDSLPAPFDKEFIDALDNYDPESLKN